MRTKAPDARLYVQNICVNIKRTDILNNVSMVSKTGEMLAVMGPTGSGKTTLLNAISGRQNYRSGSITLNGEKFNKRLRRRMAFVQQQDVFFSQLTLLETLTFTSRLRMSDKISDAEKQSVIDDIVDRLQIRSCLNTVIGDVFVKGLSGGEKKRASIACELMVDPDILLLDEPTSGLDSSTAYDIMSSLRMYAKDFNKMIIVTIHQPASRIFHMFDNVLLLAEGQIAYFGGVEHALTYFEELNLHCAFHYNPADFLLETVTSDKETVSRVLAKGSSTRFRRKSQISLSTKRKYQNTELRGVEDTPTDYIDDIPDEVEVLNGSDSSMKLLNDTSTNNGHMIQFEDYEYVGDDIDKWPTSWWTQYRVLSGRSLRQTLRVIKQGYSLVTAIIVSISCSLLYAQIGLSIQTSRDVYGLIYFYGGLWTFLPAMETLASFPETHLVINKERAAGAYRLSALYCALMTSDLPSCFLQPVIMYVCFFWVAGLGGVVQFVSTLAIFLVHTWACYGFGLLISAMCHDLRMAITILFSFLISTYLLAGYFSQTTPDWMTWIKYLALFLYPYASAITIVSDGIPDTPCNETSQLMFPQCGQNSSLVITSSDILEKSNVTLPLHFYLIILGAYTVVIRILAYLALRFRQIKPV